MRKRTYTFDLSQRDIDDIKIPGHDKEENDNLRYNLRHFEKVVNCKVTRFAVTKKRKYDYIDDFRFTLNEDGTKYHLFQGISDILKVSFDAGRFMKVRFAGSSLIFAQEYDD